MSTTTTTQPSTTAGPAERMARRVTDPLLRLIELENAGAYALLGMTLLALAWANSPWGASYEHFWEIPISFGLGHATLEMSLEHWVNDGLMAIFFFAVGLEIKREAVRGELSSLDRAMLPLVAALGGMVVPACIYLGFHAGDAASRGWGVPMATDIAFAVAALSALGKRVPPPLKIFLLALAVADDLGAVLVIAIAYSGSIALLPLFGAAATLLVVVGLGRAGVRSFLPYWVVGAFTWLFVLSSGIHATIAGVALGLLTPATAHAGAKETLLARARRALERLEGLVRGEAGHDAGQESYHAVRELNGAYRAAQAPLDHLHLQLDRWVVFFIMPVFALANAGVVVDASALGAGSSLMVALAVALGLLIGKPVGILAFSWTAVRLGVARLPRGVGWEAMAGAGILAGIGFTMSLFVTMLAFADPVFVSAAKIGILAGSTTAAVTGVLFLRRALAEPVAIGAGAVAGERSPAPLA